MNKLRIVGLSVVVLAVIILALGAANLVSGQDDVPEADREAIEATIRRSQEIILITHYTLDWTALSEVYVNDPRGGQIAEGQLQLIRYIRQDYDLTLDEVGMLDYQQAVAAWFKQSVENYEAIQERMAAEGRDTMTDEEEASLIDETGRAGGFGRGPDPATVRLDPVEVFSIQLEGDLARVAVKGVSTIDELTMVRVDDRWYIAGRRVLEHIGV